VPKRVVIIGAGPGGYVAALRAAQRGADVTIIEEDKVGGVCLNSGCIPTKTLLAGARIVEEIKRSSVFGVPTESFKIDFSAMMERKNRVVEQLANGISFLFRTRGVKFIKGRGKLISHSRILVERKEEEPIEVEADSIILATGSLPVKPSAFPFDGDRISTGEESLSWQEIPRTLIIIGGGVIGVEMASLFSSLGSSVTIVEMLSHLLPGIDPDISRELSREFKKKKIRIITGKPVENLEMRDSSVLAKLPDGEEVSAERAIVALGRVPRNRQIGLEEVGVATNKKGFVIVDTRMRTNQEQVYAIGDLIGGYLLAHVASHEGIVAAENIMDNNTEIDYRAVPNCIFTMPEIASVGMSEDDALKSGVDVKTGKFPFRALGKAHASGMIEGMVKIVADRESDEVLGIHIIGGNATDLVGEAILAVRENLKVKDIAETIHPHPTFTEALMEAAFACEGLPLHTG